MIKDKKAFGNFLREMIKQTGISQSAFYSAVEITKPYFYDILSGKVNPPPPDIQYKMLDHLTMDEQQRNKFLNLAAEGRGEVPADIALLIMKNLNNIDRIRSALATAVESSNSEV
jgi:transcriptional regulator with XRE-family HTH domain